MEKNVNSPAISEVLDPKQILREIKRRKLLVISIIVVGLALTGIYTASLPIQFKSSASLYIENFVPNPQMIANPYGDMGLSPEVIKANRILAESRPVIESARRNAQIALKEQSEAADVEYSARTDGQLLYLEVLDTNPARAAAYANAWSDAFIEEMKRKAMEPVKLITQQFDALVPQLREDYQSKLKKLQDFEEKYQFNSKEYDANLDSQKLKRLDVEESELRLKLNGLKSQQQWLKTLPKISYEDLKVIPDAKNDADLGRAKAEYERCRVVVREAKEKFKVGTREGDLELAPKIESMNEAEKDLDKAVAKFVENFNKQIENAETSYNDIKKDLESAIKAKQELFGNSHTWSILNTEAEQAKKLYDERFTQKDNTDVASKTVFTYARQWERAVESKMPFLPNWKRNIFMGSLLSLVMAVLVVLALDRLDDTVRTPRDFAHKSGLTSMGIIPASEVELNDEQAYTVVKNKGFSTVSEALRNLHISLEVKHGIHRTGQPLVITVTSAMANEGKSLVSSNLSLLFAGLGRKVLLVDGDLRKRSLTKVFKCENMPGLRDVLDGAPWSSKLLASPGIPNLFMLPAGKASGGAMETIPPESFQKLLNEMRVGFDVVIFDTPPVLPMADACIMGQASDLTVLVVRSRSTSLRQMESAVSNLSGANVKEIVCVVNYVDNSDAASESYIYGGSYGYGYGIETGTGLIKSSGRGGTSKGQERARE